MLSANRTAARMCRFQYAADATGMPPDVAGDGPLGPGEKIFWAESLTGKNSEYVEDVGIFDLKCANGFSQPAAELARGVLL